MSAANENYRLRSIHPAVWSVLALTCSLVALGAVMTGLLTARQVVVVGDHLPASQIIQASGVQGKNIFLIRTDQVVKRLSRVRTVVVRRVEVSFPNQVTIYARVRPVMVAWQRGPRLFVLDPDGHIVKQVARTNLPIVVGGARSNSLNPGVVQAVRYAVQTLPRAPQGMISTFRFAPDTGLTIVGTSGWRADVGVGKPQILINRIATLAATLRKVKTNSQQLTFIDLRYRTPYAKLTTPVASLSTSP